MLYFISHRRLLDLSPCCISLRFVESQLEDWKDVELAALDFEGFCWSHAGILYCSIVGYLVITKDGAIIVLRDELTHGLLGWLGGMLWNSSSPSPVERRWLCRCWMDSLLYIMQWYMCMSIFGQQLCPSFCNRQSDGKIDDPLADCLWGW